MLVEDGVEANGDPNVVSQVLLVLVPKVLKVVVPGPTAAGMFPSSIPGPWEGMLPDLGMDSMVA